MPKKLIAVKKTSPRGLPRATLPKKAAEILNVKAGYIVGFYEE